MRISTLSIHFYSWTGINRRYFGDIVNNQISSYIDFRNKQTSSCDTLIHQKWQCTHFEQYPLCISIVIIVNEYVWKKNHLEHHLISQFLHYSITPISFSMKTKGVTASSKMYDKCQMIITHGISKSRNSRVWICQMKCVHLSVTTIFVEINLYLMERKRWSVNKIFHFSASNS